MYICATHVGAIERLDWLNNAFEWQKAGTTKRRMPQQDWLMPWTSRITVTVILPTK